MVRRVRLPEVDAGFIVSLGSNTKEFAGGSDLHPVLPCVEENPFLLGCFFFLSSFLHCKIKPNNQHSGWERRWVQPRHFCRKFLPPLCREKPAKPFESMNKLNKFVHYRSVRGNGSHGGVRGAAGTKVFDLAKARGIFQTLAVSGVFLPYFSVSCCI